MSLFTKLMFGILFVCIHLRVCECSMSRPPAQKVSIVH